MICTCSMAGTIACRTCPTNQSCQTCPTNQWVDEGRVPSKAFFAYGVDAVEVVRCKDCIHAKEMTQYGCGECVRQCEKLKIVTSPNWFCAEGRRKDGR